MSFTTRVLTAALAFAVHAAGQGSTNPSSATSQTPTTLLTSPFTTAPSSSAPPGISIGTSLSQPPHTDFATSPTPSSRSGDGSDDSDGLINYYFIFLAIIFCIVGVLIFLIWRRKRKALRAAAYSRQHALAQDVDIWGRPTGPSRYWPGRWMSANPSREEGLNEAGEAPPPYIPKRSHEDGHVDEHNAQLAVPLQTLHRDQAGFKPPDYTEAVVRQASFASESGVASGSRSSGGDYARDQHSAAPDASPTQHR